MYHKPIEVEKDPMGFKTTSILLPSVVETSYLPPELITIHMQVKVHYRRNKGFFKDLTQKDEEVIKSHCEDRGAEYLKERMKPFLKALCTSFNVVGIALQDGHCMVHFVIKVEKQPEKPVIIEEKQKELPLPTITG
mgnify:CR=1 FL=1